jgi:hypothetical protein
MHFGDCDEPDLSREGQAPGVGRGDGHRASAEARRQLNYPEAVALITDFVLEGRSVAALMRDGATVIGRD